MARLFVLRQIIYLLSSLDDNAYQLDPLQIGEFVVDTGQRGTASWAQGRIYVRVISPRLGPAWTSERIVDVACARVK